VKNLIVALIVGVIALFCVKCNASETGGNLSAHQEVAVKEIP